MANDQKKPMGDDEYQYPNEEYVAETTPIEEKEVPPPRVNFLVRLIQNNRRVTLVVVIVLVALVAFKLLGLHHQHQAAATPVVATQNIAPPPVVETPSPQELDQMARIKSDEQNNQQVISQLQNQIQDLHNTVSQSAAAQAQLNQSMAILTEQVKQLTQVVLASKQKRPVAKKGEPVAPPLVFHLRAIVPGRAWIVSNDGLSESVAQGDSVPDYGQVQVVDANRGMVLTSSGKVIGYGENDH